MQDSVPIQSWYVLNDDLLKVHGKISYKMSSNEIWSWDVKKWMAAGDIYINGITADISI